MNTTRLGYLTDRQGNTGSDVAKVNEPSQKQQVERRVRRMEANGIHDGDGCILCLTIENITTKYWKRHLRRGKMG